MSLMKMIENLNEKNISFLTLKLNKSPNQKKRQLNI